MFLVSDLFFMFSWFYLFLVAKVGKTIQSDSYNPSKWKANGKKDDQCKYFISTGAVVLLIYRPYCSLIYSSGILGYLRMMAFFPFVVSSSYWLTREVHPMLSNVESLNTARYLLKARSIMLCKSANIRCCSAFGEVLSWGVCADGVAAWSLVDGAATAGRRSTVVAAGWAFGDCGCFAGMGWAESARFETYWRNTQIWQ